jgi:ATP-binding cassette subfamily F protein 3
VLSVQGVGKFQGKKELFRDVSFHVRPGERIGLIGPNGTGKTTLFHILLDDIEPDGGQVAGARNLRLGYLPQEWAPLGDKSVLAHAMDVDEELHAIRKELSDLQDLMGTEIERDRMKELALRQAEVLEQMEHVGGYDLEARAGKILAGLGFRNDQLDRPASTLSGGWVMRLELARLLLAEPDVLLLDEPTNHLDLDALLWLEQYLISSKSSVIVVSHDRAFLNRVVGRIFELEHGGFCEYSGNYDFYLQEKAQRKEIQNASFRNQQGRIKQIERFIEKNRYRKSRARQAQSRLKLLEKIEMVEESTEEGSIHFVFPEPLRSGKRVMELQGIRKAYGDHVVYEGIDLVIERGDRIAFLGPNGAGKSTLLRILAGEESFGSGSRTAGRHVKVGYYAQYQWEQLKQDWTILEEASSVAGDLPQSQLRSLLGAFLFRGDDVLKKVAVLSGGEKARLILCKLLLQRPNVLLLDEPTNHLDIPSRDVLERALEGFPGTVCFISHDRHFIDAIANKVLVVQSGQIQLLPGNYRDYQEIWKTRLEESSPDDTDSDGEKQGGRPESPPARKDQDQKRLEAQRRNELCKLKRPLQERIEQIEASLREAQRKLDLYNVELADPGTYQDGNRIQELQREYQSCQKSIRGLTAEWEEKALALEELEQSFRGSQDQAPGSGVDAPRSGALRA